jgi:hypothetical protein
METGRLQPQDKKNYAFFHEYFSESVIKKLQKNTSAIEIDCRTSAFKPIYKIR